MSDNDTVVIEYCNCCGAPLENGWCVNSGCVHSGLIYDTVEDE